MAISAERIQLSSGGDVTAWINQFNDRDRSIAEKLVQEIKFVTASELSSGLRSAILEHTPEDENVALFVEQHPRHHSNRPVPFYKVPRRKRNRRSEGNAPPPVRIERPFRHETGSEGIVATLLTGLARANSERFVLHPSMNQWRQQNPSHFVVVSDFIGSGSRVLKMLNAAWRVPTIRSWWSNKTISFSIVSYSATEPGIRAVRNHPSSPTVRIVVGCPTLFDLEATMRSRIIDLCERYCEPRPTGKFTPLGFSNIGGLLAFDHGAPNNMPLILHKSTKNWKALFEKRSTALIMPTVSVADTKAELIAALQNLRQQRLANSDAVLSGSLEMQQRVLILTALQRRPRTPSAVSARIGLPVKLVETIISRSRISGLISSDGRLTDKGISEIQYLRKPRRIKNTIPLVNEGGVYYVPQMLRSSRL